MYNRQRKSADEMYDAASGGFTEATIFIAAAAVADYRAKHPSHSKIKKTATNLTLELERTPDILGNLARQRTNGQLVVGFAAETEDVISNAHKKLTTKDLDIVVANDVSRADAGFDSDLNRVTILVRDAPEPIEVAIASKFEIANRILDEVVKLRSSRADLKESKD